MLYLLASPHWTTTDSRWDLPQTLPAWTIAMLAVQRQWVSREHLCTLLWPEAAARQAQHNLRVNLYRVRGLLDDWGIGAALEVERTRVRLPLATDLLALQQLLAAGRADAPAEAGRRTTPITASIAPTGAESMPTPLTLRAIKLAQCRPTLLPGMPFAGFPALAEWADLERAALQRQWRESSLALLTLLAGQPVPGSPQQPQTKPPAQAQAQAQASVDLCQALLAQDPLDDEALSHLLRQLVALGRSSQARRVFEQFRALLRQQLGVEPPAALDALAAGLDGAPAVTPNGAAAGASAPPGRDVFVGRAMELGQLDSMLGNSAGHIVTLLGPGGVGKSRLARELAQRLAGRWRDGVAWVALADVGDTAALLTRLADQIGLALAPRIDVQTQLLAALRQRQALVVLDNAEHLPELAPLLDALRAAAPDVTWLVTSRSPLSGGPNSAMNSAISGALSGVVTRSYTLEGLDSPGADEPPQDAAQAMACDAMRLLDARVRALQSDVDISAQWPACLALLSAIGAWPLAIELAASAVAQFGAAKVQAELAQTLDVLAAGRAPPQARHDSLRASLELSWRLLDAADQAALAGLSAFRGGFTRAAALAGSGASGAALARLIERALVQPLGNGRFELHPLVGQFAAEQLAQSPARRSTAQRAHADHYAGRLQACASAGADQTPALLAEVAADFENCRCAWDHLIALGEAAQLGRAAAAWAEFGTVRGRVRELLPAVAAALPACAGHPGARSALLQAAAVLHFRAGQLDGAQALARDALAAASAAADEPGQRAMLNVLALALKDLGRYAEAEQCAHDALLRCRAAGVEREVAAHANTCAILAKRRGDLAGASALYAEAIAIHRRSANQRSLATCLNNLGNVQRALAEPAAAQACFEESLRVADQHGIASTRAFALVNLAIVHLHSGRAELALSYAQRASAEPAAEIGVHLAVAVLHTLMAIDQRDFGRAGQALRTLAERARQTGLHAAMLEAVNCHAKLLAAQGRRDGAIARWLFLIDHPQLPQMERGEASQAMAKLLPTADELARGQATAARFELDLLMQDAVDTAPSGATGWASSGTVSAPLTLR